MYDPTQNDWNVIKNCNIKRIYASCTVFQGQCVLFGGRNYLNFRNKLKSVESYDHYLEKWSLLADLQVARCRAGVVTKGNKVFVIGGFHESTCEVYDSISQKISFIASLKLDDNPYRLYPLIFGNKIVVYEEDRVYKYDIKENKWLDCGYEFLTKLQNFNYSCVKMQKFLE